MGKALYREHRPLTLKDVKGQSHITDTLENAIKKGAISHAYLFTGPKGVGKTSVARILAHRINNVEYTEDNSVHLDIIEIDAASNRRIDEIRDLRDKVHIAPTSSKYKVYIIDEVHMLTREAFNALLKTLEEPPQHAVFILATTEAHKVPDTIISRSQQFSFKPVTEAEAISHLREIAEKESMSIDDDALQLIARHGNGSFRDSISMLDQLKGFDLAIITGTDVARLLGVPNSETLSQIIDALSSSSVPKLFATMQILRETGTNPTKVAQSLISLLRSTLTDDSQSLPYGWTIKLMKELLPLTAGNATFETLEVTLLGSIVIHDENLTTDSPKISETSLKTTKLPNKMTQSSPAKPTTLEDNDTPVEKSAKTQTSQEINKTASKPSGETPWDEVLSFMKKNHNTLYGFLRMAEVTTSDNAVNLTFQFDFHKRQLSQAKNIKILQESVLEAYGSAQEIVMLVHKTTQEKPLKIAPKNDEGSLSNISNIFGGAELLD